MPTNPVLNNREALIVTVLMVISIYLSEHHHDLQCEFLMIMALGIMIAAWGRYRRPN